MMRGCVCCDDVSNVISYLNSSEHSKYIQEVRKSLPKFQMIGKMYFLYIDYVLEAH